MTALFTVTIVFIGIFGVLEGLNITLERLVVDYVNPKYARDFKATFKKKSRSSPYLGNMEFYAVQGFGDNVTIDMSLWEYLSGHYQPTPLRIRRRLCDWYKNDKYLGQVIAAQFPSNVTCPFHSGQHNYTGYAINFEKVPYVPFTYDALYLRGRVNVSIWDTDTNSPIGAGCADIKISQKPQRKTRN